MSERLTIAALLLQQIASRKGLRSIDEAEAAEAFRVVDLLVMQDLLTRPRGRPRCPKCNAALPDHVPDCAHFTPADWR